MSENDTHPTATSHVISLTEVTKSYGMPPDVVVTALDDVTLHIGESEFVVVTGRSGSGKTTLLNVMAGLLEPSGGTALIGGVELWGLTDKERARIRNQSLGFVFQFPSLMPALTVTENVVLPATFAGAGSVAQLQERAAELLGVVGVADKAGSYPRQLSAGQQQRVVLARALLMEPRIILADEPTSNLDEQTEQEMLKLLRSVHDDTGVTIVMVTHAPALAAFGARRIVMSGGRIPAQTAPASA
jgi:ABC-type lipoprotein export system ATPase subunit